MGKDNEIKFHDETPATNTNNGTSKYAKIALICFLIYLGFQIYDLIVTMNTEVTASSISAGLEEGSSALDLILSLVSLAAFICSIVFGAKTVKDARINNLKGRGLGLLGIIGPFVVMVVFTVISFTTGPMKDAFNMGFQCAQVNNCVKAEDGKTAKCPFEGKEIECPTNLLKDEQYKKAEEPDAEPVEEPAEEPEENEEYEETENATEEFDEDEDYNETEDEDEDEEPVEVEEPNPVQEKPIIEEVEPEGTISEGAIDEDAN